MPACGRGQRTHSVGTTLLSCSKVWRLLFLAAFAFAFAVAVAWNAHALLSAGGDDATTTTTEGMRQQRHLPSPVPSAWRAGGGAAVRGLPRQPMLYLWASGGLGNRLFSLAGGLHLAAAAGRAPVLVWPVDDACHAPWTALFAPLATRDGGDRGASLLEDEVATVAGLLARHRQRRQQQQQQTVAFLTPRLLREVRLAGGGASLRNSRETPLAEAAAALAGRGGGDDGGPCGVYANDRLPLGFPELPAHARLRLLRPLQRLQPAVAAGVRAFAARHNVSRAAGVVGVHLRGTDAAGGGADAAAALADARRRFPGKRLFVCGDSAALEAAFLEAARLAGARAVRREKRSYPTRPDTSRPFRLEKASSGEGGSKGARVRVGSNIHRDRQATEDALVDLVLLSRTRLPDPPLRGTVPSSFYAFAGFAQGVGLFDNV